MELELNTERLRALIPGIIHEVRGETPLVVKISPWIESARAWLEDTCLGDLDPRDHELYLLAEKIVVYRAMRDAIPALDVVLSPAGFAVIDTDGRAPASKERVERLIRSFDATVDSNVIALVAALVKISEWRESPTGKWWCGTFTPTLEGTVLHRTDRVDLMLAYRLMRAQAVAFEAEAAEQYLGRSVMDTLRAAQFDGRYPLLVSMMQEAETRYITAHLDPNAERWHPNEVWHLMRPVVAEIKYDATLRPMWEADCGHRFLVEPFANDKRGGFYF